MTRPIKLTLAAIALGALMLPFPAAAQVEETVKATYGSWEIRCAVAKPELCIMSQVGKTADDKTVLEVRIRKLEDTKTADGKPIPAMIQITTPLGTILGKGVKLKVDDKAERTGGFEICLPVGCVVREIMSTEMLNELKAGNSAVMVFESLQRGPITVTISLSGFTKAFGAL